MRGSRWRKLDFWQIARFRLRKVLCAASTSWVHGGTLTHLGTWIANGDHAQCHCSILILAPATCFYQPDVEGEDLPDLAAARVVAVSSAREALAEAVKFGDTPPDRIEVTDDQGREVLIVPLADVFKES